MTAASIYQSNTNSDRIDVTRGRMTNEVVVLSVSEGKFDCQTQRRHVVRTSNAPKDTLAFLNGPILTKRDPLPQKSTQAQKMVKHFEVGSTLPMVDDNTNRPTTENRT